MASGDVYDSQKTFEQYLLDYFVKNNMHETAENFIKEAKIPSYSVKVHAPNGFLREWWRIFYDVFTARQLIRQESEAETSTEVVNMMENQSNSKVPHLALHQQRPRQFPASANSDMMIGVPATSLLAAKFYEEEQFRHSLRDHNANLWFHNANNMNPLNSAAGSSSHPQQQILNQAQQQVNIKGSALGRTMLMDHAGYGGERFILPKPGLHGLGMNGGVNPLPPNKWPLDVSGKISTSGTPLAAHKPLHSFFLAPNHQQQFQMLTMSHQPQLLAPTESFAPGDLPFNFPGSPAYFACRNLMLPRTDLSGKNAQTTVQMRKTAGHQLQHDQPQHQQFQGKGRLKNKSSTSRAKGKGLVKHEGKTT